MKAALGQVPLRQAWRPARRQMARPKRMGQRDWTPIEAEAWVGQVTPALRAFPECGNNFIERARQMVKALKEGGVRYDDLITITDQEWDLKNQIDTCLAERQAAAETRDRTTETVLLIGGIAAVLGVGYLVLA